MIYKNTTFDIIVFILIGLLWLIVTAVFLSL